MTNKRKLRALMVEHGMTQAELAKILGISKQALSAKMNNRVEFKASEIGILVDFFHIANVGEIFFNPEVS